jgi:hypothetical protein
LASVLCTTAALIGLVSISAGCLVLGEPDFREPVPNKPTVVGVEPAPTELVEATASNNAFAPITFTANVTSEDADIPLTAILLIDYGIQTEVGQTQPQPYGDFLPPFEVDEGSLTDAAPRVVSLTWLPKLADPSVDECHSITMLVVRNYFKQPPFTFCPIDDQFGLVTWQVALCNDVASCFHDDCPTTSANNTSYCPTPAELDIDLEPIP